MRCQASPLEDAQAGFFLSMAGVLPAAYPSGVTMSLKDQITEDMKNAMRAKDTARLGTIRLLLSGMK